MFVPPGTASIFADTDHWQVRLERVEAKGALAARSISQALSPYRRVRPNAPRSTAPPLRDNGARSGSLCQGVAPSYTSAVHQRVLSVEGLRLHPARLPIAGRDGRDVLGRVDGDNFLVGREGSEVPSRLAGIVCDDHAWILLAVLRVAVRLRGVAASGRSHLLLVAVEDDAVKQASWSYGFRGPRF